MSGVRITTEGIAAEIRWGTTVVDLAAELSIAHLVYSSVRGAGQNAGVDYYAAKEAVEARIHQTGIPATILRPAFFTDNLQAFNRPVPDDNGELDLLAFEPQARTGDDWRSWQSASGTRVTRGGPGSLMFVPAGCPHAFANPGSCFGRGQSLRQAGLLTLAGEDPRAARPQPPGPEWDERAREIIRLLLDGRAAEIQARAPDAVPERMFAERLDLPWRDRTRDL